MRGFNPLIVLILSFVSFVASGRLHSNARSSRLPKGPVSSRQFHYPRALVDVCAHVDLSLLANVLGLLQASGLGQICLCLSAFPLDLTADARLGLLVKSLGQAKAQATLKDLVAGRGSHCTYPDHALPKCAPGNVCDFSCADGYTRNGASCVCSPPNSVCNGKCGTHPRGCTSALPRAPKMARKSITSYHNWAASGSLSRDLPDDGATPGLLNVNIGLDLDIDALVNQVLTSLNIDVPVSGGTQPANLEVTLNTCAGAGVSPTSLVTTNKIVKSLLSLLLGTTFSLEIESSGPSPADPNTMSLDLRLCGSSIDSLRATLTSALEGVADLLNSLFTDVNIVTHFSVGGSECFATPTLSSLPLPSPSTSVAIPPPSASPPPSSTLDGINLIALVEALLGQDGGILGFNSANYTLDAAPDLTVDVIVGLSNTLTGIVEPVGAILTVVDATLDILLGINVAVRTNQGSSSPPMPSDLGQGDDVVVNIGLGNVLNNTLSDPGPIVAVVSSEVSRVLASILNLNVIVNVDGGSGCGCIESRRASAKN